MRIHRDIELRVGRRVEDGIVRLSVLQPQLVQLSVNYKGERSSSVVLTRSQVQALRQALAEYELIMESDDVQPETWDKNERRAR
jgi:preprotein translocase subunit Sec63